MQNTRYSCPNFMNLEFSRQFFLKNTLVSNFIKIRPMGAEFHADRQTDRHDETNSRIPKFYERD